MNAVDLYRKFTIEELQEKERTIKSDKKNQLTGQLYLYTKPARKKLDAIALAIYYHLKDGEK